MNNGKSHPKETNNQQSNLCLLRTKQNKQQYISPSMKMVITTKTITPGHTVVKALTRGPPSHGSSCRLHLSLSIYIYI